MPYIRPVGELLSKLRAIDDIEGNPREQRIDGKGRVVFGPILDPWDAESDRMDNSTTHLPGNVITPNARLLRQKGYTDEEYQNLCKSELKKFEALPVRARDLLLNKIGNDGDKQPFDREQRIWIGPLIVDYIKTYRVPNDTDIPTNQKTDQKNAIIRMFYRRFPDADILNRVFNKPGAWSDYEPAIRRWISSKVRILEPEFTSFPTLKRNSKLEKLLQPDDKKTIPLLLWAKSASDEEQFAIMEHFQQEQETWQANNPSGKVRDQRMKHLRIARSAVFEQKCSEDPSFKGRWEEAAVAASIVTVTEKDRDNFRLDSISTIAYVGTRLSELTDLTHVVISVGEFGQGGTNCFIQQFGHPRGQVLASTDPESAFYKAIHPLIVEYYAKAYGDQETRTEGAFVVAGNTDLGKPTKAKTTAQPHLPQDTKGQRVALAEYFSHNFLKLQGLKKIPWPSIKKNPSKYYQGHPMKIKACSSDSSSGSGDTEPVPLANPQKPHEMSDEDVNAWYTFIIEGEKGSIAEEHCFKMHGRGQMQGSATLLSSFESV